MFKHIEMIQDDGQYIDIAFIDASPKSERREWVLTIDRQGENYAMLLRSETDDGEFDFAVQLPRKMVAILERAHLLEGTN